MSDPRLFIKVHNSFPEHPKTVGLSDKAFRHLIELWCYCSRLLTDGRVPNAQVLKVCTPKTVRELTATGYLVKGANEYEMHDYLEHQQSAQEVADLRERRREAGRKGGKAKANGLASARANAKQTSSQPVADIDTDTEVPKGTSPAGHKPATRTSKETRLPDDWAPTAAHIERAKTKNIKVLEQAELFKLHAATHDRHAANWNAAFTTWLIKATPGIPAAASPWSKEFHQ